MSQTRVETNVVMETPTFCLPPLDGSRHIRLVQISRKGDSDGLQGHMHTVSLDDLTCKYVAVSYHWEQSPKGEKVYFSDDEYMIINRSAADILRRIPERKLIWIDQLCIKLEDMQEKATQVKLIPEIFSSATRVIIWLGEASEDSEIALHFATTLYKSIQRLVSSGKTIKQENLPETSIAGYQQTVNAWKALSNLLARPWFSRSWVVLEAVLSQHISFMCGDTVIAWKCLADVLPILTARGLDTFLQIQEEATPLIQPRGVLTMQLIYGIRQLREKKESISLASLLLDCHSLEASEPVDKVFSLLGLASDANDEELDPDYESSSKAVFSRVSRYMISRTKSLLTLHAAGVGFERKIKNLPSWVPDWSCYTDTTLFGPISSVVGFSASGVTDPQFDTFAGSKSLRLRMRLVDTIANVLPLQPASVWYSNLEDLQKVAADQLSWYDNSSEFFRNLQPYPTGEPYAEVYWRTLVANICSDKGPWMPVPKEQQDCFLQLLAWTRHCVLSRENPALLEYTVSKEAIHLAGLFVRNRANVVRRKCFSTELGYAGLAPPHAREGDKVCIILGASTPFLIRETPENSETQYQLVGECYVHGLMKGEGLQMGQEEDIVLI